MTSKFTMTEEKQLLPSRQDWKPKGYQKKVVKRMLQQSQLGLFLSPGLGKTSTSLAALKLFIQEKLVDFGLVIAPLRVIYSVWPKEVDKWNDFTGLSVAVLHGKNKEKALASDADLLLINPEGLPWLVNHPVFKAKLKKKISLFLDESTKFKHTNTKRFKLLKKVLPRFVRRYIMTGTPAPNGLLDLFGQIYVLDLGEALGEYISHYRQKYFYQTGFQGYEWKLMKGADKEIHKAIKPLVIQLEAEDYLELPQLIINDVYIDLDENARAAYDDMEEELLTAIDRKEIVASSAAVASGKCSQIANGGIYDKEGKSYHIHMLKAEAVADIVDELNGSPALVAYEYGHDLERLKAVLGKNTPHIGGGVTPKAADKIEKEWNAGQLPVLLGQPASIAHGLNLQGAGNHVIWHSLTWNFEFYDQFIKRVLRQGNLHKKVFVHRIIVRDTVDEMKIAALNNKLRTQKDLFEALKEYILKRKSFTSRKKSGKVTSGNGANIKPKGGKTMGKFDKKAVDAVEGTETKKKPKWTNDPEAQDQDTGETTAAGQEKLKEVAKKTGKKQSAQEDGDEAPAAKTTVKKFAKVSDGAKKKAPVKKTSKPAKKEAKKAAASNDDNRTITLIAKENPKREGTDSWKRYELYRKYKKVSSFLEAGGTSADLNYDAKKGYIKVA